MTTAGAITQSGTLAVSGTTTLAAGSANDITLADAGNTFAGLVGITSGGDVALTNSGAIVLGVSTISGNLAVTTAGAVTQFGAINVAGSTTLAAGAANAITLDDFGNDFGGAVGIVSGLDVELTDLSEIMLGGSTISGNLTVFATGDITQAAAVTVGGTAYLNAFAGGNITLGDV